MIKIKKEIKHLQLVEKKTKKARINRISSLTYCIINLNETNYKDLKINFPLLSIDHKLIQHKKRCLPYPNPTSNYQKTYNPIINTLTTLKKYVFNLSKIFRSKI